MKGLFQILIIASVFAGCAPGVHGQTRAEHTSSARAAYGTAMEEFRVYKKRTKKTKKKARKTVQRKKTRDKTSYFRGRPY